jgi:hypothetical protein
MERPKVVPVEQTRSKAGPAERADPRQTPPPAPDNHWSAVREYLVERLQLPAAMIDQAHEGVLINSERLMIYVPHRVLDNEALINSSKAKLFSWNPGQAAGPCLLPGSDKSIYITDTAVEAFCLKAIHPDSAILAVEGLLNKDKLKPYLEGRTDIFLAQGRDKHSEAYSRYLAQKIPQAKRLLPERGQSWIEEWRLHKEEKERAKVLSVESTIIKAGPVERADESLKPAAGMWR